MTSSHQRRLPWRKKHQDKNVENDETPLMILEEENTSSELESKFAEFDRILNFDQWSLTDGDSRGNNDECTADSDVESRDESHLRDLQRELEAADLAPPSFREPHDEEEQQDSFQGDSTKPVDYNSIASSSTADSFDVEVAMERINLQKEAREQANRDGVAETGEQNIGFAQFVAQMEHDFDGAILAMMENHSETTSKGDENLVDEERQPEDEHDEIHEPAELSPFFPMETVEEGPDEEGTLEIYDDESSDEDTDFTPFSVMDFPSDESQAYSSSQSDNLDPERFFHYYKSSDVIHAVSTPADYDYNPCRERQEQSFEPCVDLDQFARASVQAKVCRELEEQRSTAVLQYIAQHRVALQMGADDGKYDDNESDGGNEYWEQKSKCPIARASFICLFHILIQFFAFRALLGLLLDYHQSTTNLLASTGGICEADSGCQKAIRLTLSESGEREVAATTHTVKSMNGMQNDACEGNWLHSPALWYSLVGDGTKYNAIANPTSDNFEVSIMVLEGECGRPDFRYGPSQCCGQAGESSLTWDTVKGKEYFVAVFGAQLNTTGSFGMTIWNIQRTKEALTDHIEERDMKSFQDLAAGGSVGISMTFLAAVALA